MADYEDAHSVTATLTGTAADEVTILQAWPTIVVTNASTAESLWVRQDGTTAVAAADGTTRVLPSSARILPTDIDGGQTIISVVGDGNAYTIEGQNTVPGGNALQVAQDLAVLETELVASGKGYVEHGAVAATARPTGYASVEWYGTVEPDNWIDGDTWNDPT